MTDNLTNIGIEVDVEVDVDLVESKIQIISRQTDYNIEIIKEKLILHNNNEIQVIKEYLAGEHYIGAKNILKSSINQEIYNQIRTHLNKPNKSDKYLSYV
jgi:hypothetical protein